MRHAVATVLLVPMLAACTHAEVAEEPGEPAGTAPELGSVELTEGHLAGGAAFAAGSSVHGLHAEGGPVELAAPISSALVETLSPAVVPDAARERVVYNALRDGRPVLRLHDLETGEDVELDEGAVSAAWRGDAALAYFRAGDAAFTDEAAYVGHVVVHDPGGGEPTPWTVAPGRYVVAAWARQRLLVYRIGSARSDLLVLDGPERVRMLARDSVLLAVGPDGGRALVVGRRASGVVVRLVALGDGAELARLELPEEIEWLRESGSWTDDRAVASAATGLVVLRIVREAIELERMLRLESDVLRDGLHEPQQDAEGRILAWGELPPRSGEGGGSVALISCDPEELRCVRGKGMSADSGLRLVYNPSRPMPGR